MRLGACVHQTNSPDEFENDTEQIQNGISSFSWKHDSDWLVDFILDQVLKLGTHVHPAKSSEISRISARILVQVTIYRRAYDVGVGLVEMAVSTNPKPTIYRNLYENIRVTDSNGRCSDIFVNSCKCD